MNINAQRNINIGSNAIFRTNNGFSTALRAAGGSINGIGTINFNGTFNLTLNSGLTLLSGLTSSNDRADLTLDYSNYLMTGATTNTLNITGFRDVYLNRDITLSSQPINVVAQRNLTVGSGVTIQSGPGASGGTTLQAAGGVVSNTGLLTINGKINAGAGALTLTSGINGSSRSDLTLDGSTFGMQSATIGTAIISGFRDINLNTDVTSSAGLYMNAQRNLTIGPTATISAATETQLRAAAGNIENQGVLNLLGKIVAGNSTLLLSSGLDGTNRSNLILDNSTYAQGASVGLVDISGFNDIEFNTNLSSVNVSGISVMAQRNLTVGAGATVQSSSNLGLKAAGGVITNQGVFTLNGVVSAGTGTLTLLSGQNGGNRSDLVLDNSNYAQVASINGINLTGFRDIDLNTDVISHNSVNIVAQRDLTVAAGSTVRSGNSLTRYMTMQAAGGNQDAVGTLTIDGLLDIGTGNLTLSGGKNLSGHLSDFTWDASNILMQGASVNTVNLYGFRDLTLDTGITSTNTLLARAGRGLTIGTNGILSSTNDMTLVAGERFTNLAGTGSLSSTSGRWLVYSRDPAQDVEGSLPYSFRKFGCSYGASCSGLPAGNGFIHSMIDPNSPTAIIARTEIPDSVISLTQADNSPVVSAFDTDMTKSPKVILIFDEELARQLDLEDWYF